MAIRKVRSHYPNLVEVASGDNLMVYGTPSIIACFAEAYRIKYQNRKGFVYFEAGIGKTAQFQSFRGPFPHNANEIISLGLKTEINGYFRRTYSLREIWRLPNWAGAVPQEKFLKPFTIETSDFRIAKCAYDPFSRNIDHCWGLPLEQAVARMIKLSDI